MTPADEYRKLAAQLRGMARKAETSPLAAEWGVLALSYLRLAEQVDRNARQDVNYETPTRDSRDDYKPTNKTH